MHKLQLTSVPRIRCQLNDGAATSLVRYGSHVRQTVHGMGLQSHWPYTVWVYSQTDRTRYGSHVRQTVHGLGLQSDWPYTVWVYSQTDRTRYGSHVRLTVHGMGLQSDWPYTVWVYSQTDSTRYGSTVRLTVQFIAASKLTQSAQTRFCIVKVVWFPKQQERTHLTSPENCFLSFVGCLTSQQHAVASQGRICLDNRTYCHTEIEVADRTFHLTQPQYTDTGPTSPSADPITPGAWQGSHWSANFEVTGMTRKRSTAKARIEARPGALPLGQRGGSPKVWWTVQPGNPLDTNSVTTPRRLASRQQNIWLSKPIDLNRSRRCRVVLMNVESKFTLVQWCVGGSWQFCCCSVLFSCRGFGFPAWAGQSLELLCSRSWHWRSILPSTVCTLTTGVSVLTRGDCTLLTLHWVLVRSLTRPRQSSCRTVPSSQPRETRPS